VWIEGIRLALLNFFGSAAAAGLVTIFYAKAGFYIFLLSLPIAVVVYQLYHFYIERFEQAEVHIAELNKLYFQTIEALSSAVDAKDRYTHGHIRRVQTYAVELARCLGIVDRKELSAIQAGALLHDIGKIAIPEYILNKPTVLTETEFEKMKIHPAVGASMLSRIEFPYPVLPMVKSHHERWDGNGYPDRLKGEEIPLNARILSLVDCYDALTTNRPYRSPMDRKQIVDFFRRESGRAYDPAIVETFINNLDAIERAGNSMSVDNSDVWGIRPNESVANIPGRKLQHVEPTLAYTKALSANQQIQRELYSIFEFARAEFECLRSKDVYSFVGAKLSALVDFDVAVFYKADLVTGQIVAAHIEGTEGVGLRGMALGLEEKLSGWVAANNQALCNLPPFPDFLRCEEPRPSFQVSAIAPLNRHGTVLGAISLYRKEQQKFTDEEFRRLEMIASQTAIILAKCDAAESQTLSLLDSSTGLPNGFQLYLMFEQVAIDASRYEYPLVLILVGIDDPMNIRRKWGQLSAEEAIKATSNYLGKELRETDLLVRYASNEFIALSPKTTLEQAENLKSRLQNDLDHLCFAVRADVQIPVRVSIGIAVYPEDGTDLESLLGLAENRMQEDRELRLAARSRVKRFPTSS
jgi:diguanylate cyclase (GGDEF)-like protein/putative nucleotidyltransferase with HDIG domain